jgi:pimeloyl-ACP methyl ester carboxylesterase
LLTLSLARQYRGGVGAVVLVDPPWTGGVETGQRIVDTPGLDVSQVRTDPDDALPIGHPEVVRAVLQALLSADRVDVRR